MDYIGLGRAFKAHRIRRKMSQEELSALIGIQRSYLSTVEHGAVVALPTIEKIAKGLNIAVCISLGCVRDGIQFEIIPRERKLS